MRSRPQTNTDHTKQDHTPRTRDSNPFHVQKNQDEMSLGRDMRVLEWRADRRPSQTTRGYQTLPAPLTAAPTQTQQPKTPSSATSQRGGSGRVVVAAPSRHWTDRQTPSLTGRQGWGQGCFPCGVLDFGCSEWQHWERVQAASGVCSNELFSVGLWLTWSFACLPFLFLVMCF